MWSGRVLVCGHTGLIGSALGATLTEMGIEWVGASRSTGQDLSVAGALSTIEPCDVVIHLAAVKGVPEAWAEPRHYYSSNLSATLEVLEYARHHGARVINMSSYVYGEPRYQPIDEMHPVNCHNPYAWSKLACEVLSEAYAADFAIPVVTLRLFNLFGPDQVSKWLVSHVISQALAGPTISLDTLTPKRDFLWIDDVVTALVATIVRPQSGYKVFNLGSGKSYSNLEVAQAVIDVVGPREVIDLNRPRPSEISDCICDATLFRRTFDWQPTMAFKDGIAQLVEIWRSADPA